MRKPEKSPSFCSSSIRDVQQSGECLPRTAMKDSCYKNAALHSDFTCSFGIMLRYRFWSWKDGAPEEYVSVVRKIRVIPTENHTYSKGPCSGGFVEQCGIPTRSLNLSESPGGQNNHCFTICLTHCEQGRLRHNRDTARQVEEGLVPRQNEFKLLPN